MNTKPFHWLITLLVEMNPFLKWVILLAEFVALFALLLPPSLFQSFSCEAQAGENVRQNFQSTNGRYIDNQLIVIGTVEDIEQVVEPLDQDPSVEFALVEDCDLSYLNTRKSPNSNVKVEEREVAMRLYEIRPENVSVVVNIETIINSIDESPQGLNQTIFADPNFLTRLSVLEGDPCADPADGGGTGGGPFGNPGILGMNVGNEFMDQWALGPKGANFVPSPGITGRNVRVGVFDTSPFRFPYPLFHWFGSALPSPLWFKSWDYAGTTLMNSHGLFSAALIHRIAPSSSIQLIRVLNDNGCGDLWALNKGLEDYKSRMSAWYGDLDKTVINMSLGIRTENPANQKEVDTLRELIEYADKAGAIFIAAAGNDSAPTVDEPTKDPQEMQIPASDDLVYGVAATNSDREISCYSNQGDISAPGGDGGPWAVTDANGNPVIDANGDPLVQPCVSRADTWDQPNPGSTSVPACTDIAACNYVLISLGYTRDIPQYMSWSGTSFAAPLVSGLAALAYQGRSHDQAKCIIDTSVRPITGVTAAESPKNIGIIDFSHGLSSAVITQCLHP